MKKTEKPEFNGDPSSLVEVEQLQPLAAFPFATRPISDHLHTLGYGWYLLVGDRDSLDDGVPVGTVRACTVVWARDRADAMLVTCCEDALGEVVPEPPNPLPPVEILVAAPGWTYGELVKAGRGKVSESASYGSKGVFEYKKLWFPKVFVYFRSRSRKTAELPFAIRIVGRQKPTSGKEEKAKRKSDGARGEKKGPG